MILDRPKEPASQPLKKPKRRRRVRRVERQWRLLISLLRALELARKARRFE
jgi:hypothetical protein